MYDGEVAGEGLLCRDFSEHSCLSAQNYFGIIDVFVKKSSKQQSYFANYINLSDLAHSL